MQFYLSSFRQAAPNQSSCHDPDYEHADPAGIPLYTRET
jgi:hypothetical protein